MAETPEHSYNNIILTVINNIWQVSTAVTDLNPEYEWAAVVKLCYNKSFLRFNIILEDTAGLLPEGFVGGLTGVHLPAD